MYIYVTIVFKSTTTTATLSVKSSLFNNSHYNLAFRRIMQMM